MAMRRKVRISCLAAGFAAVLLSGAACTTVNLEDAFPASSSPQPKPAGEPRGEPTGEPAFSAPGEYPNLNVIPTPAGPQLTEQESRSTADELRARRAAQAAGDGAAATTTTSADELRRLATSHAQETLRAIEGN